jgi:hypothetical protein
MKIKLLHGRAIVVDNEIHTITVNDTLKIPVLADLETKDLFAICFISGKKYTFKVFNNVLEVPPEYLAPGEMLVTFQLIKNDNVLSTWICEKITLKEAEGVYSPIPEILELRKALEDMEKELAETKEYFKGICEGYDII